MKKIFIFSSLLISMLLVSCAGQYSKLSDGIVVRLNQKHNTDTRQIRLQVVNDNIIHVQATPDKDFSERASLSVLPIISKTKFNVAETDSTVVLSTATLQASVSKKTGDVIFMDLDGNVILQESKGGGKTFKPFTAEDGKSEYSVHQTFESSSDEAFYGLGQHQSDEFNYKGKNEELFQYNTKVSVPFVISNKNYGILWESYSLSRFGNPENYKQIGEVFKLYDKDGVEGALTGSYIPGKMTPEMAKMFAQFQSKHKQMKPQGPLIRRENNLYFEHQITGDLRHVINLPQDFRLGNCNVTYEGDIEPSKTGEYKFIMYYAGYVKIFLNNKLIVPERWRTAWNPNSYKFSVKLDAGKRIPLRVEWQPDGGTSYFGLRAYDVVDQNEQNKMSWWSEMNPDINYYFINGKNLDEVISGYRTLTGKAQIMPKWAMGFWQSREHYHTQHEIISTLEEFRKRKVPIDNIVQDWNYWPQDAWGSHEFDPSRYPDPQAMVDSIHALNGRIMISVWPKFYLTTEHYKEFDKNGWMYQQAIKDSIRDWIGRGYLGSFYDAYSPDARKLFWKQMNEHLYKYKIDSWWMDASEPNIRDCTEIEYRKALSGPTALGPTSEYFNAYALVNAMAIYNGQRSTNPNDRVFLLTRSGFSGLQRYSTATWSGDIGTRWEDMKSQISAGLNFCSAGIPYWTMDIGGFSVERRYSAAQKVFDKTGVENEDLKEWRELQTRWYQFGAFCPLFRAHGQFPYREIWNIAPDNHPAYKSILYYIQLRYRLMPYIYSLAGMTYLNDYTIMRPLIMDFTNDAKVNNIGDQFMLGPNFMVAPIYTYKARTRNIYLPEGTTWYDFYTGKNIGNGAQVVDAPYERIPLFVRAGSILLTGPDMQWSNEKKSDNLVVSVYAGKNGEFTLYEDEDVNYNYENGSFSTIRFIYDDNAKTLTIDNRHGQFKGMIKQRKFEIVLVGSDKKLDVIYDGSKQVVKLL